MSAKTDNGRCSQREQVSLYVLRALSARETAVFEEHLQACRECQQELAALSPVVDSFASWPTDILRPSQSLWGRLAQRVGANPEAEAVTDPLQSWKEPDWEAVAPGIQCKVLTIDSQRSRISMLVRLAPGGEYPPHIHAGIEELHLLEGELWIDDRKLFPGDYNRAEAPTGDKRVWSETGCTCVLITSMKDVLL